MSLPPAEIPGSSQAERAAQRGTEALPRITRLNRGLYKLVFYILGVALLLLIVGWILLAALGKTIPDGIPVVIGTIVGALTGVIAADSKAGVE
jgi:cytochrome b subunit of formate dehydrogenase